MSENQEQCRAEFEQWHAVKFGWNPNRRQSGSGNYHDGNAQGRWTVWQSARATPAQPVRELTPLENRISDLFGIGSEARQDRDNIFVNVKNAVYFADLLHAVEREFFMVRGAADEEYPDEEPQDECLLNCWGSTIEQYLVQFREALAKITSSSASDASAPPPSSVGAAIPEGWRLVPIEPTDEMLHEGGLWAAFDAFDHPDTGLEIKVVNMGDVWRHMIAAAPSITQDGQKSEASDG